MSLTIFPYSLVRYAGLDYQLLNEWNFINYHEALASYASLKINIAQTRETICDQLFQLINAQTDDHERQQLINLKRLVYNNKNISPQASEHLKLIQAGEVLTMLSKYVQWNVELSEFIKAGSTEFNQQLIDYRKYLQELAVHPTLQNGLLQSSAVLYQQLDDFIKAEPAFFKQKEYRMEFSLLRYLTRTSFKTSPFSTFTYTGLMELGQEMVANSDGHNVKSSLKLNNTLFNYLISICCHHPVINECLIIKLNKTVGVEDGKIRFLVNYNNIESFQTLQATGLQLLIIQLFDDREKQITLKELITELTVHINESSHEAIKSYLLKLVSAGLLELGINITGIDPEWDSKLVAYLQKVAISHPSITLVIDLFTALNKYKQDYPSADTRQKHALLSQAENKVSITFHQLQYEAGLPLMSADAVEPPKPITESGFQVNQFVPYKFQAKHIFFEDCSADYTEILSAGDVQGFTTKVDTLLNALRPFDLMDKERQKMRDFFVKYYNDQDRVPLINFYREYYFHVKKPEKEQQEKDENNGGPLPTDAWTTALEQKLSGLIKNGNDEIIIPKNFFESLNTAKAPQQYARGMFVQLFKQQVSGAEKVCGVINTVLPGMGKVSGRFLSLFGRYVTQQQVTFNNQLHQRHLKVELNDASSFNANIHPPLLSRELALPGGNNIYQDNQQIPINEVSVLYNTTADSLELYYSGQPVFAFDLCLESFYYRSNLYQMLSHFNTEIRPNLRQLINKIDNCFTEQTPDADMFCQPRIVYDETVIIRRKSWKLKTSAIPVQGATETSFEFYLRINEWRISSGLPERSFVFLRKKAILLKTDDKAGLADDYKPQYISFGQPLLVEMFKKLLQRAGNHIYFEEMLPDPFINKDMTDGHQVKEYLIQWYQF